MSLISGFSTNVVLATNTFIVPSITLPQGATAPALSTPEIMVPTFGFAIYKTFPTKLGWHRWEIHLP